MRTSLEVARMRSTDTAADALLLELKRTRYARSEFFAFWPWTDRVAVPDENQHTKRLWIAVAGPASWWRTNYPPPQPRDFLRTIPIPSQRTNWVL